MERLHKFLARAGVDSRRACEDLMLQGRVTVNGRVQRELGTQIDPATDDIRVDGKRIEPPTELHYVMLHKPTGVITTLDDPQGRTTVAELIETEHRLVPVGRLDMDSEGLLLMTDDGDLTFRLTHPSFEVEKEYHVLLNQAPSVEQQREWRQGVELEEGMTAPAWIEVLHETSDGVWARVVIHEGRNRHIRRVAEKLGLEVLRLIRVREGPINLGDLEPGLWRALTEGEVEKLRLFAKRSRARLPARPLPESPQDEDPYQRPRTRPQRIDRPRFDTERRPRRDDDRPQRSFSQRDEQRPRRDDDRPQRSFAQRDEQRPRRDNDQRDDRRPRRDDDRPQRSFSQRDEQRPRRDNRDDRRPRRDNDQRDDRRPRRDDDRPQRSFSQRDDRRPRDDNRDERRPRRDDDRPQRSFAQRDEQRPRRDNDQRDDRRPRRDDDRPQRSFAQRDERRPRDDNDQRDDRRPRRDDDRPQRSFSQRDDRPQRSFSQRDDRRPRRDDDRPQRSFAQRDERRPRDDNRDERRPRRDDDRPQRSFAQRDEQRPRRDDDQRGERRSQQKEQEQTATTEREAPRAAPISRSTRSKNPFKRRGKPFGSRYDLLERDESTTAAEDNQRTEQSEQRPERPKRTQEQTPRPQQSDQREERNTKKKNKQKPSGKRPIRRRGAAEDAE